MVRGPQRRQLSVCVALTCQQRRARRRAGKKLLFVTNNPSKSRAMYVEKFTKLGIQASKEEIIGCASRT
jgi:ribonucleotide monophosphatase NagD (HAD superfamily)